MPTEPNPRRWTYAPDGNSATRELDGAMAVLVRETESTRPYPPYQLNFVLPPDWKPFLTTLQYRIETNRFSAVFDIERQNVISNQQLASDHNDRFNIVWTLDYGTLLVGLDDAPPVPVLELGYTDWLELDMLLLGMLGDWPRADEERWSRAGYPSGRVTYALGGWTGGDWDAALMRTRGPAFDWPNLSRQFRRSIERPPDSRGWNRTESGSGVVNVRTGASLTFVEHFTSSGRFRDTRAIFRYRSPDFDLPIPIHIPTDIHARPRPYWRVDLLHGPLMASGWDLDRILTPRTDEEWQARRIATDEAEPKDVMKAAMLVTGVIDAVLHWQTIDGIEPPRSIQLAAASDSYAYWPYDYLNAGL
ncbi:MAG: hypothetical protein ACO1OG_05290 [Devosia sp.]